MILVDGDKVSIVSSGSKPKLVLKHGDKVKYIGPKGWDRLLVPGQTYTCCGMYPEPPLKGWRDRDEIGVYVDDPRDDFGGVIAVPAKFCEAAVASEPMPEMVEE